MIVKVCLQKGEAKSDDPKSMKCNQKLAIDTLTSVDAIEHHKQKVTHVDLHNLKKCPLHVTKDHQMMMKKPKSWKIIAQHAQNFLQYQK